MAYQPINLAKNEVQRIKLELQNLNNILKEMKERISETDSTMADQVVEQEIMADRIDVLEEEVTSLKAENIALRDSHNRAVQELNNVIEMLNGRYKDCLLEKEEDYELKQ